jgi:3-hydroxyisobutyrate dehydrogenase-like beta-hydroxyacid dehydrogenase
VVITSLPSGEALQQVVNAKDGLVSAEKKDLIVIETSTLTLAAKQAAHDALSAVGVELLDCPLSGTGAQAVKKDINIISEFAKKLNCPTPMLSAAAQIYTAALANGYAKHDSASVCAVLEEMAGIKRESSKS